LLEISWNPSHDSGVLVSLGELYALTHTIQRNDTCHGEDKQESDCFGVERADVKCRALGNMTPAMNHVAAYFGTQADRIVVQGLLYVRMNRFTGPRNRSSWSTTRLNCYTVRFYCHTIDANVLKDSASLFGATCAVSLGQQR
jgi:hypothetical protein